MSAELAKLKQQQEAQALRLQKMEMSQRANQGRQSYDYMEQPPETIVEYDAPQYQEVDDQEIAIQQLTQRITNEVVQNVTAHQNVKKSVDDRMQRLIDKYPAIQEDDSPLTASARDEYARIVRENPSAMNDKATTYELAVETAAARIGARPANQRFDPHQDFILPTGGTNPALKRKAGGVSRLTPKILANAEVMGINVDPNTPEGKKNLAELNEYSARFNADVDEEHLRFR
jgi:hypothetical protein